MGWKDERFVSSHKGFNAKLFPQSQNSWQYAR